MKLETMTLNMRLALYYSSDKDKKIVEMAKRYLAKTVSPKIKKPLKLIIKSPMPAELVRRVYSEKYE